MLYKALRTVCSSINRNYSHLVKKCQISNDFFFACDFILIVCIATSTMLFAFNALVSPALAFPVEHGSCNIQIVCGYQILHYIISL